MARATTTNTRKRLLLDYIDARTLWLNGFYSQECCGTTMQTGYDVMWLACRHVDYEGREENAYFAMCNGCGNIDVLCSQCVSEAVEEANR
jgi:hypothetical protein